MSKPVQLLISLVAAALVLGIFFIIFNAVRTAEPPPMSQEFDDTQNADEGLADALGDLHPADQSSEQDNPRAIMKTSLGEIEIELLRDTMPVTVGNFVELAEAGFYDGTRFHRVIPDFMIQGGDPTTKDTTLKNRWGTGGPGYTIEDEFVEGPSNVRGTIAMANTGAPNSGGSQFFINLADNTFLDFDKAPLTSKHPVFGGVVRGMEVIDRIAGVRTEGPDRPVEDVVIERIEIVR